MSDQERAQQQQEDQPARREQIRVRVEKLRLSRQRSVFGLPEIIGLSVSAFLLLLVLAVYFFSLAPARSRLESLNDERSKLQRQLRISQEGFNVKTDTQATVASINESLQRFESERLSDRSEGRMALYTQLNNLIHRDGLRNTAGPNYVALEPLGADQQQQGGGTTTGAKQRSGNAKWQSIYPGIGVNLTVEGQYQNLRRFIRDIELSRQFVVINSVELESIKDSAEALPFANTPAAIAPGVVRGPAGNVTSVPAARATLVSLRLDMAVYFKRAADSGTIPPATGQTR